MRVTVDSDRCRGHGVCWSLCPEVFELGDDGYAIVLPVEIDERLEPSVREAVAQCPERAVEADD